MLHEYAARATSNSNSLCLAFTVFQVDWNRKTLKSKYSFSSFFLVPIRFTYQNKDVLDWDSIRQQVLFRNVLIIFLFQACFKTVIHKWRYSLVSCQITLHFFFLETRMAEAAGKWFMEFDNSLIVNSNFVTRIKIPSADTWLKL